VANAPSKATPTIARESLLTLVDDLERAWGSPTTDMRTKQRLVRALIEEIVVDVDDATREVLMVIHWRGGQHSEPACASRRLASTRSGRPKPRIA
jgi:hypothetical protein